MVSPVDPNEIRLTGENSYLRLSLADGGPLTTRSSHWRILRSPAGPGHALFLESELMGNQIRVYADNIAMARWLQEEIEVTIHAPFGDQTIPVVEATFSRHGDVRSYHTERVASREDAISLTWYNFAEPFLVRVAAGSSPVRPHGVYNVSVPARSAQLTINGRVAQGRPWPVDRNGHEGSTCSLAWSETWVRPR